MNLKEQLIRDDDDDDDDGGGGASMVIICWLTLLALCASNHRYQPLTPTAPEAGLINLVNA